MKTEYLQIRLSQEMKKNLKKEAEKRGLTMTTLIMLAVEEYLRCK